MLSRYTHIRHKTKTVVQLYAYSTAALEGEESSAPSFGCFAPGTQTQYPLYMKQDEPRSRSGWARKNLAYFELRITDRPAVDRSLQRLRLTG